MPGISSYWLIFVTLLSFASTGHTAPQCERFFLKRHELLQAVDLRHREFIRQTFADLNLEFQLADLFGGRIGSLVLHLPDPRDLSFYKTMYFFTWEHWEQNGWRRSLVAKNAAPPSHTEDRSELKNALKLAILGVLQTRADLDELILGVSSEEGNAQVTEETTQQVRLGLATGRDPNSFLAQTPHFEALQELGFQPELRDSIRIRQNTKASRAAQRPVFTYTWKLKVPLP